MCSPSASRYPRAPTRPSWESCWARPSSSSLAFGMTLGALGPLGPPFPILWVVGVVNAMNFIDGVDGLASGIAAIAGTTLLLTALVKGDEASVLLAACLIGSMLGFLRHNFNPARIIMGDFGSMFVGYVLGGMSVMGLHKDQTEFALFGPQLFVTIHNLDLSFAIVRRFRS